MARQLQEVLDSGELTGAVLPKVRFTPQVNDPTEEEGLMFYQSKSKTHVSKNNIPNVSLNIGQEQYIHVINKTGSPIINGEAVRYGTTDIATGLPTIIPALANAFSTASVGGIATHSIDVDQEGIITTFGKIGGLDTTGLTIGETLFLSETTPGNYQLDPPDIATRVGFVLVTDDTDGVLFVKVENITAIPPVSAYMNTAANITTITAAWHNIVNYADSGSVVMISDPVVGTITTPIDGIFRVGVTLSMTFNSTNGARQFELELWDATAGSPVFTIPTTITKDVASYDFSTSAPFTAFEGHVYIFRISSPTSDLTGVVLQFTTFDIQSVHIR